MVVFDTSILLLLLSPNTKPPIDPDTGEPVSEVSRRINSLIDQLSKTKITIIIPTPVLAELLVGAGSALPEYIDFFKGTRAFRIAPFDIKAAIEHAYLMHEEIYQRKLRKRPSDNHVSRATVKFDQQIIAIAKAENAETIYSDDKDILRYGNKANIRVLGTRDLPIPQRDDLFS